jgi:hypothetical protein
MQIYTGANGGVVIDSSGRVGIGTTAPTALLDVQGSGAAGLQTIATFKTGANPFGFQFQGNHSNNDWFLNNYYGAALSFGTNNTEKARLTSDGKFLVGTSTSLSNFVQGGIQLAGTGEDAFLTVSRYMTSATDAGNPGLVLARSGSNTKGTNATVVNGNDLGQIYFAGANGSSYNVGASIKATVDGAVSGGGAGDMPSRLVFSTTSDSASSPTERLRITSTGQMRLAGAGITFNGDTAAANELDDYEEGTFTPALGDLAGGVSTMSTQEGKYVKVGKIVQFSLQIVWTAKNTWTGANARINGLPFAATANTGSYYWPNPATMNCNLTTTAFNYAVEASTTQGYVMDLLGNQIDSSQWPSSGRVLVNGVYQAA